MPREPRASALDPLLTLIARRRVARDRTRRPVEWRLLDGREVNERGCWIWIGFIGADGYGIAWNAETGRREGVHRIAYREMVGDIPPGVDVHHKCGERACFNPEHLEAIAHGEHIRRHRTRRRSMAAGP